MRDPKTLEEWQEAADAANFLLELESCRMFGLIEGGPEVNLARCESILNRAAKRGIAPRKLTGEEICQFLNSLSSSPAPEPDSTSPPESEPTPPQPPK